MLYCWGKAAEETKEKLGTNAAEGESKLGCKAS